MNDGIDLYRWLRTIWQRRYTIGIVTLAFVMAAVLSGFLRPVYESHALIQLSSRSSPPYATPSAAAQVLSSLSFLEAVARVAGIPQTGRELQGLIKVEPVRDTQMIRLTVRHKSAEGARDVASAVARAFVSKASEQVQQRREVIRVRLDAVNAQLAEIQRIVQLSRAILGRLQRGATIRGDEGALDRAFTLNALSLSGTLYRQLWDAQKDLTSELYALEPPTLIEAPFAPVQSRTLRNFATLVFAAVLGLMAGTALAFVMEAFGAQRSAPIPPLAPAASDPPSSKERRD